MTHVVIVGGGFAGLRAARDLGSVDGITVTLFDARNHHLFQPLLYQVAMAGLSPAEIAAPIRSILSEHRNVRVLSDRIVRVDLEGRRVHSSDAQCEYDFLILACGARHSYFGHPEWEEHAPGLKTLAEATEIRRRVLSAFEDAEIEQDLDRQRALLTFVVVGGGPTGVELAGAIGEMSRFTLARDFRRIESATTLWAAGVEASPLNRDLGTDLDRQGRIAVQPDLSLPNHPEVYVAGDQARVQSSNGEALPGVAPVAMQQGAYLARHIRSQIAGESPSRPFEYVDKGHMATIGRRRAVLQMGRLELGGFIAWLAWLVVHVYYLVGFKNRLFVVLQWAWAYLTFRRGARLIVDRDWRARDDRH